MGYEEIVSGLDDLDDEIDGLAAGDDYDVDELFSSGDDDDETVLGLDEIVSGAAALAKLNLPASLKRQMAAVVKTQKAAAVAKRNKLLKARNFARLAALRGRPALIRQRNPMINCDLPVSFQSAGTMAPGTTQTIQINAPSLWAPYDLLVPSDIASCFALVTVQTGLYTLNPGGAPIKLLSFTEDATSRRQWKIPTIQPGQPLVMTVQNITGGTTVALSGEWWGKIVG